MGSSQVWPWTVINGIITPITKVLSPLYNYIII
jgi:hypothetical protein